MSDHFLEIIKNQFSGIKGGVVQGSRLGHILFDVFLNDLIGEIKSKCP